MNFKPGDIVKLKGQDQTMTVLTPNSPGPNSTVTCAWYDNDLHLQKEILPVDALEAAGTGTGPEPSSSKHAASGTHAHK
jgi:hypothetical protein